jgi:hypothetical protein
MSSLIERFETDVAVRARVAQYLSVLMAVTSAVSAFAVALMQWL